MASNIDVAHTGKVDFTEEVQEERVSVLKIFQAYLGELANQGYEVLPSPSGKFQNSFNVCKQIQTAKLAEKMPGLSQVPPRHSSQLPIEPNAPGWDEVVSDVTQTIWETNEQKEARGILSGLELAFGGLGNTFSGFNVAKYFLAKAEATKAVLSLEGSLLAHKIVPVRDWFDPRIQDIKAEDLLRHLAGQAEVELFKIFLGRTVAGGRHHRVVENHDEGLDTGCRIIAVLLGEAGNGKSFTLGIIKETLDLLGYSTGSIENNFGSHFGWDKVAAADFSVLADLSGDDFKKLTGGSLATTKLLQIATGDKLTLDIKNLSSIQMHGLGTLAFATNEIPVEAKIEPNEGMVSRVCILTTVTKPELGNRLGCEPINAKQAWEKLLIDRGIEPDQGWLRTLAAYLLRLCLDNYIAINGYTLENGSYVKVRKTDLEKLVESLKLQCAERLECSHKYELPDLAIRALAVAALAGNRVNPDDLLEMSRIPWSWRIVDLAWKMAKASNALGIYNDDYDIPSMSRSFQGRLGGIEAALRNCLGGNSEPNQKHMELMKYFNTDAGIGYPRRVGTYSKLWDSRLGDLGYYVKMVQADLESGVLPNHLLATAKNWLGGIQGQDL